MSAPAKAKNDEFLLNLKDKQQKSDGTDDEDGPKKSRRNPHINPRIVDNGCSQEHFVVLLSESNAESADEGTSSHI